MDSSPPGRIDRESLQRALEKDELFLLYQPIVSVEEGSIVGFEALVRWQHPQRKLLGADEVLSVAEETGLTARLDAWVLAPACREAAAWAGHASPLRVHVNISAASITDPRFPEVVEDALAASGLEASALALELRETAAFGEEAASVVSALGRLGASIWIDDFAAWIDDFAAWIDDFATGFSSLARFKELEPGGVKIHRPLLQLPPAHAAVAKAMLALAHGAGVPVVATQIESREELEWARTLGCDLAQGIYLAPPRPGDSTRELAEGSVQLATGLPVSILPSDEPRVLIVTDRETEVDSLRVRLQTAWRRRMEVAQTIWQEDDVSLRGLGGEPDCVFLDLRSVPSDPTRRVAEIQEQLPRTPIILWSREEDDRVAVRAIGEGAQDYLVDADTTDPILRRSIVHASARHRVTRELRSGKSEAEAMYQDLFEEAPCGLFSVGANGRILMVNRHGEHMVGYPAEQLIGRPVLDLYADSPGGKPKARQLFRKFRDGEAIAGEELQVLRGDGSTIWIRLWVNPIRDVNGRVVASRSASLDVTECKRAAGRVEPLDQA